MRTPTKRQRDQNTGVRTPTKGQRDQNTGEQREHRPCGVPGTEGCPGATKEAEASQEMSEGKVSGVVRRVWSGVGRS